MDKELNFWDWYKKEYDPKGFLYPSAPIDISFETMVDRVNEYLEYYKN